MGGVRDWMFLDGQAEEIRERVAHWEHHTADENELAELQQLFKDMHGTEGELRDAAR